MFHGAQAGSDLANEGKSAEGLLLHLFAVTSIGFAFMTKCHLGAGRGRDGESGGHHKNCLFDLHYAHTCHGTNTMSYRARRSVVSVVSMFVIRLHRHLLRITFAMAFLPSGLSVGFHLLYPFSVDGLGQRERAFLSPVLFFHPFPSLFNVQLVGRSRSVRSPMHKLKANS